MTEARLTAEGVEGRRPLPKFYHCGICDAYHFACWNGDCREDIARLDPDNLDSWYGSVGWVEVDMLGTPEKEGT